MGAHSEMGYRGPLHRNQHRPAADGVHRVEFPLPTLEHAFLFQLAEHYVHRLTATGWSVERGCQCNVVIADPEYFGEAVKQRHEIGMDPARLINANPEGRKLARSALLHSVMRSRKLMGVRCCSTKTLVAGPGRETT